MKPIWKPFKAPFRLFLLLVLGSAACSLFPNGTEPASPTATLVLAETNRPVSTRPVEGATLRPPVYTPTPGVTRSAGSTSETPGGLESESTPAVPTSQLVFIADEEGRLAQWEPGSAEPSLLAYRVVDYAVSGDGRVAVALRVKTTTGGAGSTGDPLYELLRIDLRDRSTSVLVESAARVYGLALSFQGDYLAYTTLESGGIVEIRRAIPGTPPVEAGMCQGEQDEVNCRSAPAWAPDRTMLAWSDSQGVWLRAPGEQDPLLAVSSLLKVTDPRGGTSEVSVRYTELSWSPNGRYLLGSVSPVNSEIRWLGVLDTRTGRQAEIQGTFETGQTRATAAWLANGQVVVGVPGSAAPASLPSIQTWNVLPTRDDLLLAEKQYNVPLEKLPWVEGAPAASLEYEIAWLSALRDRYISFAVRLSNREANTVVFLIDVKYGRVDQIYEFEDEVSELLWSPDSQEGLMTGARNLLLYLPGDGRPAVDLLRDFGIEAHSFSWINSGRN